ncbi:MAG TPA: hypothetical protein VH277_17080 [Gemmatimonadaceae bacterium]|nr:hypothetical protein [Gemmatimonadaceae bacterium]
MDTSLAACGFAILSEDFANLSAPAGVLSLAVRVTALLPDDSYPAFSNLSGAAANPSGAAANASGAGANLSNLAGEPYGAVAHFLIDVFHTAINGDDLSHATGKVSARIYENSNDVFHTSIETFAHATAARENAMTVRKFSGRACELSSTVCMLSS